MIFLTVGGTLCVILLMMSSLHRDLLKLNTCRLLPPSARKNYGLRGRMKLKGDLGPVSWNKYFEDCKKVSADSNTFNIYTLGNSGPLLLLLHGGGYSGLTWALFAKEIFTMVECQIVALDIRGHGGTTTTDDSDLSANTLAKDIRSVISQLYCDSIPPTILMGHSMGGAIAVHTAHLEYISSIVAVIVIDVVEGTAVEALASMQSFLRSRPSSFKTVKDAISWSLFNGQVKNVDSAQVSVPGQIKNSETGVLAAFEEIPLVTSEIAHTEKLDMSKPSSIPEIIQEDSLDFKLANSHIHKYLWRIDLAQTEPYWREWFQGLSTKFLECHAQKLLLLANIDRLDKDLTVGQMQGKFAMHILTRVGHAVHEDEPDQVAEVVANFLVRNKFSTPKAHFKLMMPAC